MDCKSELMARTQNKPNTIHQSSFARHWQCRHLKHATHLRLTFFVPWFFLKNLNPSSGWAGLMIVKVKAVYNFKLAESNTISLQH